MVNESELINQYKILEPIGKGGMGEVFLAQDTILDRRVAVKFLSESMAQNPVARKRFLREAKSAASLDHPFICKVYETGEYGDKTFIAMEYLKGQTLQERLKAGGLSTAEALKMGTEIAEALETAHEHGIVHRDLKPANIMLTPQGHIKVMDFGLAKHFDQDIGGEAGPNMKTITQQASLTEAGAIAGTIAYMSPEQARGEKVDSRSDLFSFGLIMYEMSTGRHPFMRTSGIETLTAILRDPTPPPRIKPKSNNPVLSPILRQCLAKEATNRYQNTKDLVSDLKKAQRNIFVGGKLWPKAIPLAVVGAMLVLAILYAVRHFTATPSDSAGDGGPAPVSVLIADFQNMTNDPVFDGAIEQALNIGLEGASFITTYRRPDARKLAGELNPEAGAVLDSESARLVCVREGIGLLITGSIEPRGDGYTIKTQAADPVNLQNQMNFDRSVSSKSKVLEGSAWLARKIREELGDMAAEAGSSLTGETFSTSSLAAMHAYTRAQELSKQGHGDEAIKEYEKALAADPEFGRAYSGLALVYRNRGQTDLAEDYFQEALAHIDRMSDREKFRTRGIYYLIHRNFTKAIEENTQLIENYPADHAGHSNLALAYFFAHNYSQAKLIGQNAVNLFPKNINPRYNLSWYALADGDLEMAEREVQNVLQMNPAFTEAFMVKALVLMAGGRIQEAEKVYQELAGISAIGGSLSALGLADLELYRGDAQEAVRILKDRMELDRTLGRTEYLGSKWLYLARAYSLGGQRGASLQAVETAIASSSENGILLAGALLYARAGQLSKAGALAESLKSRIGPEPRAYARLIQGEILLHQGSAADAAELFKESQDILDTWLSHVLLGKAYLALEAYPDAHAEFELCLKRKGEATSVFFDDVPSFHYFPDIHFYYGLAQDGLGSDSALDSFRTFLEIKSEAQQNPLVDEARRRIKNR